MNYKILKILFTTQKNNIAISFVNSALNPKPSICIQLSDSIKKTKYGYGYRLMEIGYNKLSTTIAFSVETTEDL